MTGRKLIQYLTKTKWRDFIKRNSILKINAKKANKKVRKEKMDQKEIDDALDPFSFENYCGACIYFNTENCAFKDKVFESTEWKSIKCKKFWD